jgi:hypothetical protein
MSSLTMPDDRFGLKLLHQWKVSASAVELEKVLFYLGSSDERDMIKFYKVLFCPPIKGKAAWETEKFSSSNGPDIYLSLKSMHPSLFLVCLPRFLNLGMRFFLRGRAVTPRVTKTLIIVIRPLIDH